MKLNELAAVSEASKPEKTITITLGVRGDAEYSLAKLLHNISSVCSMGCSREWGIVDGDRGESVHNVGFDGDGPTKLIDVKIDGKPVKDYVKKKAVNEGELSPDVYAKRHKGVTHLVIHIKHPFKTKQEVIAFLRDQSSDEVGLIKKKIEKRGESYSKLLNQPHTVNLYSDEAEVIWERA